MQLNIKKIDERIQKLQEIKRIAADPELLSMLLEFISNDQEWPSSAPTARPEPAPATHPDDVDLVDQVLNGTDRQGTGFWPRKRS